MKIKLSDLIHICELIIKQANKQEIKELDLKIFIGALIQMIYMMPNK